MTDIVLSPSADLGGVVNNAFGEHSLFGINRNLFQGTDASTVFRSYFGEALFEEDRFYIIAGMDSGLLYQYVKSTGIPKGSRYLFVELPEVLARLDIPDENADTLVITTREFWLQRADAMKIARYSYMNRLTLLRSLGVVHGHYRHYPPFWQELKGEFDSYIAHVYSLIRIKPFIACQIINLTENQVPATCLVNSFQGKTAVVLAGGPSLDGILPWVKQHREHLLVIAVSRIARPLIEADIRPDISVSVDPQAFNLNVCKDMLEFEDTTLLVNSYHLSPNLLASWGGQKVFVGPRYPWNTAAQPQCMPSAGGTTVTNSSLDLAVRMGATQVVVGGVDFCFAQDGYTHASGTVEHKMGSMPQRCELQVETNSGMMADTAKGYVESGKHFDLQAQDAIASGCRVINPSPGSMRLPHVEHVPLNEIRIDPLPRPARDILASIVPATDSNTRIRLYKEELVEMDRLLKELREIKNLAVKGLDYNKKIYAKEPKSGNDRKIDPEKAIKINRIDEQLVARHADTIHFFKHYDITRFTDILRLDLGELDENVKNNQIYFQALIDCSEELSAQLQDARTRILSRMEEENPHADVRRLLDQWRRDLMPGRAISWGRQHAGYVQQLPATIQAELTAFQDTFDESVEALGRNYIAQLTREAELDGITARAREQFFCADEASLWRIRASLQGHHEPERAASYIPLIDGYLAELSNDIPAAIAVYQGIGEGPTYLDALIRLFQLYTKTQDWTRALAVLKTMHGISTTYSPMYADLLYATGDVDQAVEIYTEYLLANPEDLNTMMKLGKLFLQCGSVEGVEWSMGYILAKDPGNHTAKQILKEISTGAQSRTSS